jgi:hypothetical protein
VDWFGHAIDGAKKTNLSARRARASALAAYVSLKLGEESRTTHERQTARNRRIDLDGSSSRISEMISSGRLAVAHGMDLLLFDALDMSSGLSDRVASRATLGASQQNSDVANISRGG